MPGYPVVIPDVVIDRMGKIFKTDPGEILNRPAPAFGGKSAIQAVADGDQTWEQVLSVYEGLVEYQVTQ